MSLPPSFAYKLLLWQGKVRGARIFACRGLGLAFSVPRKTAQQILNYIPSDDSNTSEFIGEDAASVDKRNTRRCKKTHFLLHITTLVKQEYLRHASFERTSG